MPSSGWRWRRRMCTTSMVLQPASEASSACMGRMAERLPPMPSAPSITIVWPSSLDASIRKASSTRLSRISISGISIRFFQPASKRRAYHAPSLAAQRYAVAPARAEGFFAAFCQIQPAGTAQKAKGPPKQSFSKNRYMSYCSSYPMWITSSPGVQLQGVSSPVCRASSTRSTSSTLRPTFRSYTLTQRMMPSGSTMKVAR